MFADSGYLFELVSALTLLVRLLIGAGFIAISAHLWRQTRIRGSAEMTTGFSAILILSFVSMATTTLTSRVSTEGGILPTWFWAVVVTIAALQVCAQLLVLFGASRLVAHLIGSSKPVPSAA
jgi:hypothetical protein